MTMCCIQKGRFSEGQFCEPCQVMQWYHWAAIGILGLMVIYLVYAGIKLMEEIYCDSA